MFKTHLLGLKSIQNRNRKAWRDWDFVLEIEQRATDPQPAVRAGYWSPTSSTVHNMLLIDWGDGQVAEYPNSPGTGATSWMRPPETMQPGKYIIKIRLPDHVTSTSRYFRLSNSNISMANVTGYSAVNDVLPQLTKILKADCSKLYTLGQFAAKSTRLTEVCKFTGCDNVINLSYMLYGCINLSGTVAFDNLPKVNTAYCSFGWTKLNRILLGRMPSLTDARYLTYMITDLDEMVISDLVKLSLANYMFYTSGLKKIVIPGGLPAVTDMTSFAASCGRLESVEIRRRASKMHYCWQRVPVVQKTQICLGEENACSHLSIFDVLKR